MPLGFAKSIFSRKVAAEAAAGATGWFGSEYDGDTTEGAYNLVGDAGVGNTWGTDNTYSVMFWFKGTASDIADGAWTVMRWLNTGDDSHTVTLNTSGVEPIIQNGTASVANASPANFSTNYLDDAWHHCAIEFNQGATSSEIWLDGVKQSISGNGSDVTPDNPSRYFYINGRSFTAGLQDGSGNNTRASSMQIADFWYKSGDANGLDLDSNMSTIYSSGWQDLGTDGTASSTLPTPDIWLYVDSNGDLQNGGAKSATWAEAFGSGTGGNWIESASGGPGA